MAQFGGNPTGRKSQFKFAAGTPEGDEQRRKHEAERKRAARAVAEKLREPPPLPSAGAGVADQATARGAPQAPLPGGAVGPAPVDFVPWESDSLQELTDEIIHGCEEGRVLKFRNLAVEEGLRESTAEKVANSQGKYKPAIKRSLMKSAPKATANMLNRLLPGTGKYSAEGIFLLSVLANTVHGRRQLAETRRIIQEELAKEKPKAPTPSVAAMLATSSPRP